MSFDPGENGLCRGCAGVDERRCTCETLRRLRGDQDDPLHGERQEMRAARNARPYPQRGPVLPEVEQRAVEASVRAVRVRACVRCGAPRGVPCRGSTLLGRPHRERMG